MNFFRRLGLGLATSLLSVLLVVFALSMSTYLVLDKPATVKNALRESGVYQVLVENTLAQKQQQLGRYLPVANADVQQAVREAFSPAYLQATIEPNVDATYDWVHGVTQTPDYQADLHTPKEQLAQNISQLVNQKLATLPVCTNRIETPTTVADVLAMSCRPPGVPNQMFVMAAQQGITQSNVFDQVVTPVLTLQDEQGQSLTNSLSAVPEAYDKFKLSLWIVPLVLILCALAILFWSLTRRQGSRVVGRSLITTGLITILLSLAIVWLLGKGAQWTAGSNNNLILLEGKVVEIAHLIGAQLRNWLVGIGVGYVLTGIMLLIIARIKGNGSAVRNQELNKSLGYNDTTPSAGTTFDPGAAAEEPETTGSRPVNRSVRPADAPGRPAPGESQPRRSPKI